MVDALAVVSWLDVVRMMDKNVILLPSSQEVETSAATAPGFLMPLLYNIHKLMTKYKFLIIPTLKQRRHCLDVARCFGDTEYATEISSRLDALEDILSYLAVDTGIREQIDDFMAKLDCLGLSATDRAIRNELSKTIQNIWTDVVRPVLDTLILVLQDLARPFESSLSIHTPVAFGVAAENGKMVRFPDYKKREGAIAWFIGGKLIHFKKSYFSAVH